MNSSQIHLALTHVPVILSFVGLIVLIVAFIIKNPTVTKTSFYILLAAGLFALPVYFTGEGAEEVVEDLPGVSEGIIEEHAEFAGMALIIIAVAGLAALTGLVIRNRYKLSGAIRLITFVLALASAAAMAWTAHLGGQIRHSEIRSGVIAQNENNNASDNSEQNGHRASSQAPTEEQTAKAAAQTTRTVTPARNVKEQEDED